MLGSFLQFMKHFGIFILRLRFFRLLGRFRWFSFRRKTRSFLLNYCTHWIRWTSDITTTLGTWQMTRCFTLSAHARQTIGNIAGTIRSIKSLTASSQNALYRVTYSTAKASLSVLQKSFLKLKPEVTKKTPASATARQTALAVWSLNRPWGEYPTWRKTEKDVNKPGNSATSKHYHSIQTLLQDTWWQASPRISNKAWTPEALDVEPGNQNLITDAAPQP